MKTCKTCNTTKPYSDFYKHSQMTDGYLNTCKECKRKQQQEIRNNNLEYYQNYDRNRPNKEERNEKNKQYLKTENGKLSHAKSIKRSKEKYPLKYKAKTAVGNAVRDGKLIKPTTCESCGAITLSKRLEGHHCDYSKPLEVMWLCIPCHKEWHKNNTPLNSDEGLY